MMTRRDTYPLPPDETARLALLHSLRILDTPPEERFERITRVAQQLFDVPIAVITLVDANRLWFKACQGLDVTETPRGISFCAHAILSDQPLVIPDTRRDPRFVDNPLVTGPPYISFYAGQPLAGPEGRKLGTLCIMDRRSRALSTTQLQALRDLAVWAEQELTTFGLTQALTIQRDSEARIRAIMDTIADGVIAFNLEGRIEAVNPTAARIFEAAANEIIDQPVERLVPGLLGVADRSGAESVGRYHELVGRRADGAAVLLELAVRDTVLSERRLYVAALRDITARKQVERQLAAEHAVTKILADAPSLDEATGRLLETFGTHFGWEVGELWLRAEHMEILHCAGFWHAPTVTAPQFAATARSFTFAPGIGLPGRVWAENRPMWLDISADVPHVTRAAAAFQDGLRSAFGFPVRLGASVIGVLTFLSRELWEPDEALLQVMDAIATQIGQFVARKRAETAQFRLAAIVESSTDVIIGKTLEGMITDWNPAAERLYGYAAAEVIGQSITILAPPDRPSEIPEIMARLKKGELIEKIETVRLRKDGTPVEVALTISPVRNAAGQIIGASTIATDISARKRVEHALAREREFLNAVLEHLHEGIVACDADGVLTLFNRAAQEFHGLPQESVVAELWAEHYGLYQADGRTPLQMSDVPLLRALRGEDVQNVEMVIAPRNQPPRTVLASGRAFYDAQARKLGAVVAMHDITERKRIEAEREQLLRQLQGALKRTDSLYRAAQSLVAIEDLTELLQRVVDDTAAALPADRVTAITLDLERRNVSQFVAGGPGASAVTVVAFDELWDGLTGSALRELAPILSSKSDVDPRESPAVQHRRMATDCGAIMVVPLRYRNTTLGTITAINRADEPEFAADDLALLEAIANQASAAISNAQLLSAVQQLALTDGLTNVLNRRGLFSLGQREVDRALRVHRPLAAIMLDVDHFKRINDTYGHAAGDEVLRAVADGCRSHTRTIDLVGRYGGEEFAVVLPDTDSRSAREVAERLRSALAATPIATAAALIDITISLGIAEASDDTPTLAALLDRADSALYAAKQAGRNQVVG